MVVVGRTYCAGVDGEAVILVLGVCHGDCDAAAVSDVDGVGVVASLGVSIRVIDGNAAQCEAVGTIDADHLDGRVLDADAADR